MTFLIFVLFNVCDIIYMQNLIVTSSVMVIWEI